MTSEKKIVYQNPIEEPISELIQRLSAGDLDAIDLIYLKYHKRLKGYGIQLLGFDQQEEVQDVMQEFFLWLAQHYDKVAHIRDFEVYLFQSIRRNLHLRMKRKETAQSIHHRFSSRTASLNPKADISPEEAFIRDETNVRLNAWINNEIKKLPTYQKEVLYLRYYEELDYDEIAEILAVSNQVARNYCYRAIKSLKAQFGQVENILFSCFFLLINFL
ncbi:MAG: sigma-70 family RNA polymerase sigma factor [Saprospiraceae bacterium]